MNTTIVLLLFLAGAVVPTTTDCDVEENNQPQWAKDNNCQREERIKLIENALKDAPTADAYVTKGDLEILQGNLTAQSAIIQALQDNFTAQAALVSDHHTMLIQTFQDATDAFMLLIEDANVTKGDLEILQGNMTTTGTQLTNLQNKAQKSVICGARTKVTKTDDGVKRFQINSYDDVTAFGTATTSEMDDGIYTVGTKGVYQITVSGDTVVRAGNTIRVFLKYNDSQEHDRMIYTYSSGIKIHDTASQTRFKKLNKGDRVGLYYKEEGTGGNAFNNVEFCIKLYQAL